MAGYKAPGRALGVLLAVVALLAVAVRAVDDEHMYHWKCFTSCNRNCRDDDSVAKDGDHSGASNASAISVGGKCKGKCLNACFEDLPAHCYHQCVVKNCLCFPPFSKEKTTCLKSCCDKCFHPVPPGPGPKPPGPPKPPPKPAPQPPAPTKPKPPMPKPPTPKPKPPPSPKKPCPCPPGSEEAKANNNN